MAVFPDPAVFWQGKGRKWDLLEPKVANLVDEAVRKYDPDQALSVLLKNDIGHVTLFDSNFPPLLKELPDAPVILYFRGSAKNCANIALSIVGSRKFTSYGQKIARTMARECVQNGLAVVSGLALGIDTEVHRTVVESGGITIGVLACGLDQIYPISNSQLAESILAHDGAIVSEYPPGTLPMKQNFPARNRIIAGLSSGTLVIEAAADSGALITAYQALEYNREVFAIPGNIDSFNSAGTNKLIQDGAKMVTKSEDIFVELNISARKNESKVKKQVPESAEENMICDILKLGDLSANEIVNQSGMNVIAVNSIITILEMKGIVHNTGGGRYKLK